MGNRPPWFFAALIFATVFLTLVVVNIIAVAKKPSDETQIRAAIEEMRVASIEGKAGGVQQYLSDAFRLPEGMNAPDSLLSGPKAQVANFIRQAKVNKLDVKVLKVEIFPDKAYAKCDISADFAFLTQEFSQSLQGIQIEFRREEGKRLMFIPDPQWKVLRFGNIDINDLNL